MAAHGTLQKSGRLVGESAEMSTRARDFLLRAMACERMAGVAMDDAVRKVYLDLAAQWRDLARQAEKFEFHEGPKPTSEP